MKKNSNFMQPECRVIRFGAHDVIATSQPLRSGANEEYEEGNTTSWF